MNQIKTTVTAAVAAFFSFFGLLAVPLCLLVPCMVIDWFTGIASSKVQGIKITSDVSFKGIVKKMSMLVLVFVGWALDVLITYVIETTGLQIMLPNIIACIVAVWLVLNELISITENVSVLGVDVPFLKPIMHLIKDKVEETVKTEETE